MMSQAIKPPPKAPLTRFALSHPARPCRGAGGADLHKSERHFPTDAWRLDSKADDESRHPDLATSEDLASALTDALSLFGAGYLRLWLFREERETVARTEGRADQPDSDKLRVDALLRGWERVALLLHHSLALSATHRLAWTIAVRFEGLLAEELVGLRCATSITSDENAEVCEGARRAAAKIVRRYEARPTRPRRRPRRTPDNDWLT